MSNTKEERFKDMMDAPIDENGNLLLPEYDVSQLLTAKQGRNIGLASAQQNMMETPVIESIGEQFDIKSKYHKNITSPFQLDNLEDFRGHQQSAANKILTGIPRLGIRFGAAILEGAGSIYGLGEAALTGEEGEGYLTKVAENSVNKGIEAGVEWLNKEIFPVYFRDEYQDKSAMGRIVSPEGLATSVADGLGFGLSSLVTIGALGKLGMASKLAKVGMFGTGLSKALKAADTVQDINNIIGKGASTIKALEYADGLAASAVAAWSEATIEAGSAAKEYTEQEKQKKYSEYGALFDMNDPEQKRLVDGLVDEYINSEAFNAEKSKVASEVMGKNMAVLTVSNMLDVNLFFGGFKNIVNPTKKIAEKTFKQALPEMLGKMGKEAIAEGLWEEGMQTAITGSALETAKDDSKDILESFGDTFKYYADNFKTTEMQESILLGALISGVMSGPRVVIEHNKEMESLYGRPERKKEDLKWYDKILFRGEQSGHTGLLNMASSLTSFRDMSYSDFIERDENNQIVYNNVTDSNGVSTKIPKVDVNKFTTFGKNIGIKQTTMEVMQKALETGNEEAFELAKSQYDLSMMIPFFDVEGGTSFLKDKVEAFYQEKIEKLEEAKAGTAELDRVRQARTNLLDKADTYSKIYSDLKVTHNILTKINPKEYSREEADKFVNQVFNEKLSQLVYIDTIKKLKSKNDSIISDIESKEDYKEVFDNINKNTLYKTIGKIFESSKDSEVKLTASEEELLKGLKSFLADDLYKYMNAVNANKGDSDYIGYEKDIKFHTKLYNNLFDNDSLQKQFEASEKDKIKLKEKEIEARLNSYNNKYFKKADGSTYKIFKQKGKFFVQPVKSNLKNEIVISGEAVEIDPLSKNFSDTYSEIKAEDFYSDEYKATLNKNIDEANNDASAITSDRVNIEDTQDSETDYNKIWDPIPKRKPENAFTRLAGNAESKGIGQERYFNTVFNTKITPGNHRLKIVKPFDIELTIEDLQISQELYDLALFAVLTNNKGEYINEKGDAIQPYEVKEIGIYTSVPLALDTYVTDNERTFDINDPVFQQEKVRHEDFRNKVFDLLNQDENVYVTVRGKSGGVLNAVEMKPMKDVSKLKGKRIVVNTSGKLVIGLDTVDAPKGFTYVVDDTTDNWYALDRITLEELQDTHGTIDGIISLLDYYASRVKFNPENNTLDLRNASTIEDSGLNVWNLIKDVVFFSGDNKTKNGKEINKNPNTQFYFRREAKTENGISIPGGKIVLAGKSYQWLKVNNGVVELNPVFKQALRDFLKDKRFNIRSSYLNNKDSNPPIFKTAKFENGKLNVEYFDNKSYQEFLEENILFAPNVDSSELPVLNRNIDYNNRSIINKDGNVIWDSKANPVITKKAIKEVEQTAEVKNSDKYVKTDEFPDEGFVWSATNELGRVYGKYNNIYGVEFLELNDGTAVIIKSGTIITKNSYDKIKTFSMEEVVPVINKRIETDKASGNKIALGTIQLPYTDLPFDTTDNNTNTKEELKTETEVKTETSNLTLSGLLGFKVSGDETIIDEDEESAYREIGVKKELYEIENKEQAREWLKSVFGNNVDFQVSKANNILGSKAWGYFTKNAIHIWENAEVGTTYHEAFHAVMALYLNESEKNDLFREVSKIKKGLDEKQMEEYLAESFRDYMLTGEIPSEIKSKQRSFFQKLKQFLEALFTKGFKSAFESLNNTNQIIKEFDKIRTGYYAKASAKNIAGHEMMYRNIPGMDTGLTEQIMEGVNFYFFRELHGNPEYLDSIYSKYNERDTEIFKNIYDKVLVELQSKHDKIKAKLAKDSSSERLQALDKIYSQVIKNFWYNNGFKDSVVGVHSDYVAKFDITVETPDEQVIETEKLKDSSALWSESAIKYDQKRNASKNIKLLIANLPQLNDEGKLIYNELNLPKLVDFKTTFKFLSAELRNSQSIEDVISKLLSLVKEKPYINVLVKRLKLENNINNFSYDEFKQLTDFAQTFSKYYQNYQMDIVNEDDENYIFNVDKSKMEKKILSKWSSNIARNNSNPEYSKYYSNDPETGMLKYNRVEISKLPAVSGRNIFDVLKIYGVEFTNQDLVKWFIENSHPEGIKLIEAAQWIQSESTKEDAGLLFSKYKNVDLSGNISTLVDMEILTNTDLVENSHFDIKGDVVFNNNLYNFLTYSVTAFNNSETLEDLYEKLPHLRNSAYAANSVWMQQFINNDNLFQVTIHEGSETASDGEKKTTDKMSVPDVLRIHFNNGLKGSFPMLRPSSNALERMINTGYYLSTLDILKNEHIRLFKNYLLDEIMFLSNQEIVDKSISNIKKNNNKGIVIDIIRNSQLNDNIINDLETLLSSEKSKEAFDKFILQNEEGFTKVINDYFEKKINNYKDLLVKNKLIEISGENVVNYALNSGIKNIYELNAKVKEYLINDSISNIEQTKLFIGNPIMFKSIEDLFKRLSTVVGTKKLSMDSPIINNWINQHINRYDGKISEINNPTLNTIVHEDITVVSEYFNQIQDEIGSRAKGYKDINEADAQALGSLDFIKESKIRASEWSYGKGSLEELYQYEIQKYLQGVTQPKYTDPFTKESWIIDIKSNKSKFSVIKPVYYGPIAGTNEFYPSLYKLSIAPIIPSELSKFPKVKQLFDSMVKGKVDFVLAESANKVGTLLKDGQLNKLYDENNEFSLNNPVIQKIYWKYFGIQLETGDKRKEKAPTGTQFMKHIFNGLMSAGREVNPGNMDKVKQYYNLNAQRIELGKDLFKSKLGLELEGNNYKVKDYDFLISMLKDEFTKRELPLNMIEGLDWLKKGNGLSVLLNKSKVENILYALADSNIFSQKRFGTAAIQVSTVLREAQTRGFKVIDGKKYMTSNDLKFYSKSLDGNINAMECYLPNYYKNVDIDKLENELLEIIGFRIPTQGLNSIEAIKIKGFLPESYGDVIILPSEITAKAGSDFDVDKLQVYLKNFYIPEGSFIPKEIKLSNWEKQYEESGKEDKVEFKLKAIENEMLNLQRNIILNPNNYKMLVTPNTSEDVKKVATFIREKLKNELKAEGYNSVIDREYLLKVHKTFLQAKQAVGITALSATFHVIAQVNDLGIRKPMLLPHNISTDNLGEFISLGSIKSKDGAVISDSLSQWINAAVDAEKDPFMFDMNANMNTLSTYLFLTSAGVPLHIQGLFMNQPIIREFIEELEIEDSTFRREHTHIVNERQRKLRRFEKTIISDLKNKYKSTVKLNDSEVLSSLEAGLTGSLEAQMFNALQLRVLDEYIKYKEIADDIRMAIQGLTYDTNSPSTLSSHLLKLAATNEVINNDLIVNYKKALGLDKDIYSSITGSVGGFIAPYYNNYIELGKMFKPLFKDVLTNTKFANILADLVGKLSSSDVKYGLEDKEKILEKLQKDFITFLVVNRPYMLNGELNNTSMVNSAEVLFSSNGIGKTVDNLKVKYPGNKFLKELYVNIPALKTVPGREDIPAPYNISMYEKNHDNIESDEITNSWSELYELEPKAVSDLIKFVFLQSGLKESPINFIKYMPSRFYNEILNSVLTNELTNKDTTNSYTVFKHKFYLNNYNDPKIVPQPGRVIEGLHPFHKKPRRLNEEYKESTKEKVNVSPVPVIEIVGRDRAISINSVIDFRGNMFKPDWNEKTGYKETDLIPLVKASNDSEATLSDYDRIITKIMTTFTPEQLKKIESVKDWSQKLNNLKEVYRINQVQVTETNLRNSINDIFLC